jgi:predicted MFS family arabinose efflux permease
VEPDGRYKWRLIAVLFSAGALNYADRTALSAVFPLLTRDLGATSLELGAIGTVFLWSYALASPVAGILADRISRSRAVVLSLAAWSAVTLLSALAVDIRQLLATRALLGFAEALYLPAATAMIADYHGRETRGFAMGLHSSGLTVGMIAGGTAAGYLGERFGWRAGLVLLGLIGLALSAAAYMILRDPRPSERNVASAPPPPWRSIVAVLSVPSFIVIMTEAMLVSISTWIFLNWLPLYFREDYGMSLGGAGFAGTFTLQTATALGMVGGGAFADRIAARVPRRRMLMQTVCYVAASPFLLAFLWRPQLAVLHACIFLFAFFARAGTNNENPLVCDLLGVRLRSTAIGLCNTCNCFAGGLGVLAAGLLKSSWGLNGVFAGISAIMIVTAVLTAIGYAFLLGRDLDRAAKTGEAAA